MSSREQTAVWKVTISSADIEKIVEIANAWKLPITAWETLGYSEKWEGVEKGVTFEVATANWLYLKTFIKKLLRENEEAAYVTKNGAGARLLFQDGRMDWL